MTARKFTLLAALGFAAMTSPAWAGGYVDYVCAIDGYSFGVQRQGHDAVLQDAGRKLIKASRKAASVGERYIGKTADGHTFDVWLKDTAAVVTVGKVRHDACWIQQWAKLPATNYVCANRYAFATKVVAPGKIEYIDGLGNSANLAVTGAPDAISYHGATPAGLIIDLTLGDNKATLTSSGGASNLACQVR